MHVKKFQTSQIILTTSLQFNTRSFSVLLIKKTNQPASNKSKQPVYSEGCWETQNRPHFTPHCGYSGATVITKKLSRHSWTTGFLWNCSCAHTTHTNVLLNSDRRFKSRTLCHDCTELTWMVQTVLVYRHHRQSCELLQEQPGCTWQRGNKLELNPISSTISCSGALWNCIQWVSE